MFSQVQGAPGCCRPDDPVQTKQYKHAADQSTCEEMCERDAECLAYEYTLHRRLCEVYPVHVHNIKPDKDCQCWSQIPAPRA